MNYIKLNPQYIIRNEKGCSYIVKLEQTIDNDVQRVSGNVFVVPPVIGFIVSKIGKYIYEIALKEIALSLGIDMMNVEHFTNNLIRRNECKFVYNKQTFYIPPHLLIHSKSKDEREYYFEEDFTPLDKFVNKRPTVPFNVSIMVTTACNTNCIYCYAKRNSVISLPLQNIKNIIDECRNIGVANIALTGGDIFARKDWKELLAYTTDKGYSPFLSTKTPLADDDIAFLKGIGINKLQFSLDSIEEDTLQIMVKCSKSYIGRVKQMFACCQRNGFVLNIRSVITSYNGSIENFGHLYTYLSQFDNIADWVITPAFYSEFKKDTIDYTPRNEQLASISSYINYQKKIFPIYLNKIDKCGYQLKRFNTVEEFVGNNQICHAGTYMLSILATGICTPCEMLYDNPDFILGCVYNNPLTTIWNSPKALEICTSYQMDKRKTASPCKHCKVLDICRKSIDRRVCFVDISKTMGKGYFDYPDPRCPKSNVTGYIL